MKRARKPGVKRLLDVVLASVLVALTSPLMVVIALAIRLESEGPAFFRQERVGRGGETFRIHKFRSMRSTHSGDLVCATGDSRVTRLGAILRRTKLDELPQLFDVLAGQMSFVGPRPEVPRFADLWPPTAREIIVSVRPGITDPASVALRNEADELAAAFEPEHHYIQTLLPLKTAMYVHYVENQSLRGDLGILLRTLLTVVRD